MPGFKSNDLYQNRPKIKLLLQTKLQNLRALRPLPPDLQAQTLPLQISGFAPGW